MNSKQVYHIQNFHDTFVNTAKIENENQEVADIPVIVEPENRNKEVTDRKEIHVQNVHNMFINKSQDPTVGKFEDGIQEVADIPEMVIKSALKPSKCRICEKILNNDRSLKIHMENAHSTVSVKPENQTAVNVKDGIQEVADMKNAKNSTAVNSDDRKTEFPTAVKFEEGNQAIKIDLEAVPIAVKSKNEKIANE